VEVELPPAPVPEPKPSRTRAATPARGSEPDIPLRPRTPVGAPPAPRKAPAREIDLTGFLADLHDAPPELSRQPVPPPASLDEAFEDFRSEVSKQTGTHEAGEQLTLAKTYLEMSMTKEAIAALMEAARAPTHRFEAALMLGRLYQKRNEMARAAEWLERAAEAPAPSAGEGRELLYDLGAILESVGEVARALAVFLELQADAGEYRDVAARVERLARIQTGG
jgi:tetratricopeptide (TPR) repeat protein